MIRLIALDLDNTLLDTNLEIPADVVELLQKCAEKGVVITIATGRLFLSAEKYAKQIGPKTRVLCYNGALVTKADGDVDFESTLTTDQMRKIIAFAKERDLYCQFYEDHKILVEEVCEGTTIDPDLANTVAKEVRDFDQYELKPSYKGMIVVDPECLPETESQLKEFMCDSVYIAQSQPWLIEIMPLGVNKAMSLSRLCVELGIAQEEVMACGDNTNDAEMVSWAGVGVAVANGVDSLKAIAQYVCEEERSYGVAEAIRKYCNV